ncbi:glycoside hydrolase/deacetylase [Microstroma glucosiphilum]|uniref:Glycoside hydrolase/deacetylase n=1 Tax=Pseudomicrostroma glucosiphilum TaxID=1684307 RepID=A0A316UEA1_9BASI|nr:glycoside hydrolase/deacetylase [Pseudomicrostroma glucosiphilum]PWN23530.1 glycoside hydrolase/deacetylase [Pseudomicrostroma glucosiphilum]
MKPFNAGPSHTSRDLIGYGSSPPSFTWPNGARLAISFVLNYEEGAENTLLNGDEAAEGFLTENGLGASVGGPLKERELSRESTYAYGSRVGFWRILGLFKKHGLTFTSWAVGKAVELNPAVVEAMEGAGCEVASHAYRWINYASLSPSTEQQHIRQAYEAIQKASPSSTPPLGWYTGRVSMHTRRLVYEHYKSQGLLEKYYDSDAYDDDLPYYLSPPVENPKEGEDKPVLIVPYTLEVNDMKFAIAPGFSSGVDFGAYLQATLDTLLAEAEEEGKSAMMTVGLHCRISGRPGRFGAVKDMVERVEKLHKEGKVWCANRGEIAAFWREKFPPQGL